MLNIARSRTDPSDFRCWRIAQICFGLRGAFAPIMRPAFQGLRGIRKRSGWPMATSQDRGSAIHSTSRQTGMRQVRSDRTTDGKCLRADVANRRVELGAAVVARAAIGPERESPKVSNLVSYCFILINKHAWRPRRKPNCLDFSDD